LFTCISHFTGYIFSPLRSLCISQRGETITVSDIEAISMVFYDPRYQFNTTA